jgi:hypothetical protein
MGVEEENGSDSVKFISEKQRTPHREIREEAKGTIIVTEGLVEWSNQGAEQDVKGASSKSIGQRIERAGLLVWAKTLDRVDFGMTARKIFGWGGVELRRSLVERSAMSHAIVGFPSLLPERGLPSVDA